MHLLLSPGFLSVCNKDDIEIYIGILENIFFLFFALTTELIMSSYEQYKQHISKDTDLCILKIIIKS